MGMRSLLKGRVMAPAQVLLSSTMLLTMALGARVAHADTTTDVACFSTGTKVPIRFEMRTYFDRETKFSFASVRYAKSKATIPIVMKSVAAEAPGKDQPYEFTTTWLEIADGAVSGTYKMVHQGVNVSSMVYTNLRARQSYEFILDTHVDSTLERGCAWVD